MYIRLHDLREKQIGYPFVALVRSTSEERGNILSWIENTFKGEYRYEIIQPVSYLRSLGFDEISLRVFMWKEEDAMLFKLTYI